MTRKKPRIARAPLSGGLPSIRWWLGLLWFVLLGLLATAKAQAREIAILKSSDLPAYTQAIDGFKVTAPPATNYVEYDLRGDPELGKKLARRIRASDASLVLAVGPKAALAAQTELPDIPIVYMMILDPAKHSLAAPNMTGTLMDIPAERQFKILHSFLPSLHRVGILYDPGKAPSRFKEAIPQAAANGIHLKGFPVESEKDVPQQLRALLAGTEALWLAPDSTVLTEESVRFILESAMAHHIPVIGFSPELTRLGALFSISVSYSDIGRETGLLVKRLLNGEKKLPIKPVPIERLNITVNQKTANFLSIVIPDDLERMIDEKY